MKKIHGATLNLPSDPTEAAAIIKSEGLDTGLPRLGQYSKLRVNIKESIELKVSCSLSSYETLLLVQEMERF